MYHERPRRDQPKDLSKVERKDNARYLKFDSRKPRSVRLFTSLIGIVQLNLESYVVASGFPCLYGQNNI